jgi:hypothetical protein
MPPAPTINHARVICRAAADSRTGSEAAHEHELRDDLANASRAEPGTRGLAVKSAQARPGFESPAGPVAEFSAPAPRFHRAGLP